MLFWPYTETTIETELSLKEIKNRLQLITETSKLTSFLGYFKALFHGKPFIGKVYEESFQIVRKKFYYLNGFLPVIYGVIEEKEPGCWVHIKMKMLNFRLVLWLGFIGTAFGLFLLQLPGLLSNFFNYIRLDITALIPIAVLLLVYFTVIFSFNYEVIKSESMLLMVLNSPLPYQTENNSRS